MPEWETLGPPWHNCTALQCCKHFFSGKVSRSETCRMIFHTNRADFNTRANETHPSHIVPTLRLEKPGLKNGRRIWCCICSTIHFGEWTSLNHLHIARNVPLSFGFVLSFWPVFLRLATSVLETLFWGQKGVAKDTCWNSVQSGQLPHIAKLKYTATEKISSNPRP